MKKMVFFMLLAVAGALGADGCKNYFDYPGGFCLSIGIRSLEVADKGFASLYIPKNKDVLPVPVIDGMVYFYGTKDFYANQVGKDGKNTSEYCSSVQPPSKYGFGDISMVSGDRTQTSIPGGPYLTNNVGFSGISNNSPHTVIATTKTPVPGFADGVNIWTAPTGAKKPGNYVVIGNKNSMKDLDPSFVAINMNLLMQDIGTLIDRLIAKGKLCNLKNVNIGGMASQSIKPGYAVQFNTNFFLNIKFSPLGGSVVDGKPGQSVDITSIDIVFAGNNKPSENDSSCYYPVNVTKEELLGLNPAIIVYGDEPGYAPTTDH